MLVGHLPVELSSLIKSFLKDASDNFATSIPASFVAGRAFKLSRQKTLGSRLTILWNAISLEKDTESFALYIASFVHSNNKAKENSDMVLRRRGE